MHQHDLKSHAINKQNIEQMMTSNWLNCRKSGTISNLIILRQNKTSHHNTEQDIHQSWLYLSYIFTQVTVYMGYLLHPIRWLRDRGPQLNNRSPTASDAETVIFSFFDLGVNKRLSKQSWGWWFETPFCSLWRHCNDPPPPPPPHTHTHTHTHTHFHDHPHLAPSYFQYISWAWLNTIIPSLKLKWDLRTILTRPGALINVSNVMQHILLNSIGISFI